MEEHSSESLGGCCSECLGGSGESLGGCCCESVGGSGGCHLRGCCCESSNSVTAASSLRCVASCSSCVCTLGSSLWMRPALWMHPALWILPALWMHPALSFACRSSSRLPALISLCSSLRRPSVLPCCCLLSPKENRLGV